MVYYQPMSLIVKTEQPQFCAPLSNGDLTAVGATGTPNLAQPAQQQQQHQQQQQQQHSQQQQQPQEQQQQQHPQQHQQQLEQQHQQQQQQQHSQQQQQHFAQNCTLHSNTSAAVTFLHQQQSHQQQSPPSITNISSHILHGANTTPLHANAFAATSVKTEQLPPGTAIYSEPSAPAPVLPMTATSSSSISSSSGVAPTTSQKPVVDKPKFKCAQCGMIFGSKSAHTSHTKSHAKGDKIMEDMMVDMPLGIPKKPLIKANLGNGDPYQCNVCQKSFAVPARLIRHYRTHTGERPFECEWCHKLFSVKENLQVHRRIHTKERPYQCQVCDRAFEHSGKLHRHNRIHTGERPHGCTLCDKTFIQSGQLVIHMRTHTGEKPYKCPVEGCGKGFTCSKQLKVHSRTHTGEKPYRCDICQREFGYNHVLKLHRMQHYGSKCYKCTICDDTFKNKKEMEAHIKGHANDLPDEGRKELSCVSSSSSSTQSSSPGSPHSPVSSVQQAQGTLVSLKKVGTKTRRGFTVAAGPVSPPPIAAAHSPPAGFMETMGSAKASPTSTSTTTSPTMITALSYETEDDSSNAHCQRYLAAMDTDYALDERPTDLRVLQQQHQQQHHEQQMPPLSYSNNDNIYQAHAATYNIMLHSPPPSVSPASATEQLQQHPQLLSAEPTINPALLEAASIATRMSQVNIVEENDAETQAALQIMQLHRSHQPQLQQVQQEELHHDQPQHYDYDDTQEANQLIEHYKRGELAAHGIHKGYAAPVPKFESSLLNNEIIVRQVEAAIAPLRSSTESPERASSPESDSNMMMADRDVMTLPLRKRKVYMSEGPRPKTPTPVAPENGNGTSGTATTTTMGANVIRMSSVIQFAKAS